MNYDMNISSCKHENNNALQGRLLLSVGLLLTFNINNFRSLERTGIEIVIINTYYKHKF